VKSSRLLELLEHLEGRALTSREWDQAREAVELARTQSDKQLLGRALICFAAACQPVGSFEAAATACAEAVALFIECGDRACEAQAHYHLGVAYWNLRRWSEALLCLERAVAVSAEVGDTVRQIRSLNVIAVVQAHLGNYPRSFALHDQALALCHGDGFEMDRLLILNNKAQNLLNRARGTLDPDEALRYADAAYGVLIPEAMTLMELWSPGYRRVMLDTVGQCLVLRHLSKQALDIFRENLALSIETGDRIGEANTRIGLAESLLDLGRPQEAADMVAAVLAEHETALSQYELARARLTLSNAYQRLGRFEDALTAFFSYHAVVKSTSSDLFEQYSRHLTIAVELEKSRAETATYKRLAEELRKAQAIAEAASRAKSEFLSNMSHELRTPLNAIIGFADIMRGQMFGTIAPRYRAYLDDIHRSGQHLLELINQLLDLSKAEEGKLDLSEEIIDLDEIIGDAVMLVRESAMAAGIVLEELPDCKIQVRADPLRIKQCLINILSNAVKFTRSGGAVSISVVHTADGIGIEINDTGIGLADEDVPKVFERFGQGGNARAVLGTGLGLPLTKQLMELHGGSVALRSERGTGTTVILHLPHSRVVQTPVEYDNPRAALA
jgi:signal transduction histidine kinase